MNSATFPIVRLPAIYKQFLAMLIFPASYESAHYYVIRQWYRQARASSSIPIIYPNDSSADEDGIIHKQTKIRKIRAQLS